MTELTRRTLLAGAAGTAALASSQLPQPARAAAPPAGRQAPSFYRYKVGDFEVTVISDGAIPIDVRPAMVRNTSLENIKAALEAAYLPSDRYWNQFNPVLVNTGARLVLLDAGNHASRAPTTGRLPEGLAAAGVDTKAIDVIVISHFHADHIGGLRTADYDALAYPNAEIMVPAAEWTFWMDDGNMSRAPAEGPVRNTFNNVRRIFGSIADKVTRYEAGKEVVPGITTIPTPGHTPGHASFLVASGAGLVVQADVTGNPAINLRNPGWHTAADMDGPMAEATRRRLYDMVAAERMPISGYHYAFPATGYAEKDGERYRLVPVAWNPAM